MIRTSVLSIQQNKNTPRIWIEGMYLESAGFSMGRKIRISYLKDCIQVNLDARGDRIVCCKKSPIIDINNRIISRIFRALTKVKVSVEFGKIQITKTTISIRKITALQDGSYGSVFSGGGLFDEAAALAGLRGKFAIELDKYYADIFQQNHKMPMHNMSISDVDFAALPKVEFLIAGIPCEPHAKVRRSYRRECHEKIDLPIFFLMVVQSTNPRTIILEEVPYFLKSEIGLATIQALKRMGYNVESRLVAGTDYGELQVRRRAIIIASYDTPKFPKTASKTRHAREILESPNSKDLEWFDIHSKPWLVKSWQRKTFKPHIVTEKSTTVAAITKRYAHYQQQAAYVKHPRMAKFRKFTQKEIKKLMTLRQSYKIDKTDKAIQVLGQGVIVRVLAKIIRGMVA